MNEDHEQQTIYVQHDGKRKKITCDKGIVPLIRKLWNSGFETVFSCEGKSFQDPYVIIVNNGRLSDALDILYDFWKSPVAIEINRNESVIFRAMKRNDSLANLWAALQRNSRYKAYFRSDGSYSSSPRKYYQEALNRKGIF